MKKYSLFIVFIFIFILGCTKDEVINQDQIKDVIYSIEKVKETSYANVKRYSLYVVVPQKVNTEQLEIISKVIIRDFKKKNPFNAISIGFYDYKEYIEDSFTLGYTEYVPKGEWSKADTVKTGDYSSMKYSFKFKDKDWSKRLTQDEVKIYSVWIKYLLDTNLPENIILNKVANQFNIETKEVNKIIEKHSIWSL